MFLVGTIKAYQNATRIAKCTPLYDHFIGPLQILFEIRIIKI